MARAQAPSRFSRWNPKCAACLTLVLCFGLALGFLYSGRPLGGRFPVWNAVGLIGAKTRPKRASKSSQDYARFLTSCGRDTRHGSRDTKKDSNRDATSGYM